MTITFTALNIIELLNVISSMNHFKWLILLNVFITLLIYMIVLVFFQGMFQLSPVDMKFIMKVFFIVAIAWGPIRLGFLIKKKFNPSLTDKVTK